MTDKRDKLADQLQADNDKLSGSAAALGVDDLTVLFTQSAKILAKQGGRTAVQRATRAADEFAEVGVRAMAYGDLLARYRLLRSVKSRKEGLGSSFARSGLYAALNAQFPDFLNMPFEEAIAEFAAREPALLRRAQRVEDAYMARRFTFSKATSKKVVSLVQQKLVEALRDGLTQQQFVDWMLEEGGKNLSKVYVETVFRTNISTAQHAGRMDMLADPDLRGYILGLEYVAQIGLPNVRENHAAMHGVTAAIEHSVWRVWIPPNGYNCRCTVLEVTRDEAEQTGRLNKRGQFRSDRIPNALPDPGFRHSPRGLIYG